MITRAMPHRRKPPTSASGKSECLFCAIAHGEKDSVRVFEDADTLAFLDHRPLFPGHCLLVTKAHCVTLADLPGELASAVMRDMQLLSRAVQEAMQAEGTFIAVNNIVSQSVPHFHVHIVPRRKGDGLRGFFWPRRKYANDEEAQEIAEKLRAAIVRLAGFPSRREE